jgi:hypothetical protein
VVIGAGTFGAYLIVISGWRAAQAVCGSGQVTGCVVSLIQYFTDSLTVQCANTGQFFNVTGPSTACTRKQTADTLKAFLSMAQASYLSGRPLTINFFTASPGCPATNTATLFQAQ